MDTLTKLYEPHTLPTRARLETDPALVRLLSPSLAPHVLERFLIEWMARAVYMTEPVDGWIRRTGERCIQKGLERIGRALIVHARSETGHHLMTLEDTHALVRHWNDTQPSPTLHVAELVAQPPTGSMKRYRQLHEETIEGEHPVGQIAIEREVGYLAVSFGPRLMRQVERVLGADVACLLTFMTEHVAVDVGHTLLNEKLLSEALLRSPEHARPYAEAGARALDAYIDFLGDCMRIAEDSPAPLRAVA